MTFLILYHENASDMIYILHFTQWFQLNHSDPNPNVSDQINFAKMYQNIKFYSSADQL